MDPALLLFAFAAGAASFFAPCCVAMLPAYVGYAVRAPGEAAEPAVGPWRGRAGRFLAFGGLIPFAAGSIPLIVAGIGTMTPLPSALTRSLPGLGVGVTLLLAGAALAVAGLLASGRTRAAGRGAAFGLLASAGFFAVYLTLGLPVAFLARSLAPYLTWLAVLVGLGLVVLGASMLMGRTFAPNLPSLRADVTSPRGFFLFGAGYGLASLSCTFPVFIAVVAAGVLGGGFLSGLAAFGAYALGKSVLLVSVTIVTVVGGMASGRRVRQVAPYATKAGAVLVMLSGVYIAYAFTRYSPGF